MDDSLISRVHDLPPEIFDQIRTEVLTLDVPKTLRLRSGFAFPKPLHIDRYTRQKAAEQIFQDGTVIFTGSKLLDSFTKNFDIKFLDLINRFIVKYPTVGNMDKNWNRNVQFYRSLRRRDQSFTAKSLRFWWTDFEHDWLDEGDDSERGVAFAIRRKVIEFRAW